MIIFTETLVDLIHPLYKISAARFCLLFGFLFWCSMVSGQVAKFDFANTIAEMEKIQEQILYDYSLAESNVRRLTKKYRNIHIPELGVKMSLLKVRLYASKGDMLMVQYELNRLEKIRFLKSLEPEDELRYRLYSLSYKKDPKFSEQEKQLVAFFTNSALPHYERLVVGCRLYYLYAENGNIKEAIRIQKQLDLLLDKVKKDSYFFFAYTTYGQGHYFLSNPVKSRQYFEKTKTIAKNNKWRCAMQYANLNIGETYLFSNNLSTAKLYFDSVILDKKTTELRDMYQVYGCLEYYFQLKNMPDSSYHYLEMRNAIDDRLEDEKSENLLSELDNALTEEISAYKYQAEIKKNQQLRATISIIIILSMVITVIMVYLISQIKRTNILLKRQKAHVEMNLHLKESMIKEIHHRIKNNLQIVSSILNLQSKNISDPTALQIIEEGKERIQAIAIIHNQLHLSKDAAFVEMDAYILQFVEQMKHSFIASNKKVKFNIDVENLSLPIDFAVPVGLIFCELLSNSYKHAFLSEPNGEIGISLKRDKLDKKKVCIEYCDNGIGYRQSTPFLEQTSTGVEIIQAFVEQLEATFSFVKSTGFHIKLEFNVN